MTTETITNNYTQDAQGQYTQRQYAQAGYRMPDYGPAVTGGYGPQQVAAPVANPAARTFDDVRYWVGGGLTAAIAALIGLIGLVVSRGILHIPVVVGSGSAVSYAAYGLSAAGLAILAAGLFAGMIRVAPRPVTYYAWIVGMVSVLAALLPFTTTASLHSQIAFGVTNLAVGLVIALLVPLAASHAKA
jgi:hypothetical protein